MKSGKLCLGLAIIAIAAPLTVLAAGGGFGGGGGGPGGGGFGGGGGGPGGGGFGGGGAGGGGFGGAGGGGFGGGGGGPGGGGGGGGRGGFNTNSTDYIRTQVTFSDDEWAVIQPKLQKVMDAQAVVQGTANRGRNPGGMGGAGGFAGGPGGAAGGVATTTPATVPAIDAVAQARQELQIVLSQEPAAAPEAVKTKLNALRDARVKAKELLTKAQQDLAKVLTIRQEAMLVNLNILE